MTGSPAGVFTFVYSSGGFPVLPAQTEPNNFQAWFCERVTLTAFNDHDTNMVKRIHETRQTVMLKAAFVLSVEDNRTQMNRRNDFNTFICIRNVKI